MRKSSELEEALAFQVLHAGLPPPTREFRFAPPRLWRFDFAWQGQRLAVEVDGGLFVFGGHSRGAGQLKNMEKMNTAVLLGWRVLRVGRQHIRSGEALEWIERGLGRGGAA